MENNYVFYIDDFVNEIKQHINLSENTWITIYEDIKNFYISEEKESFSGFLNKIFLNYYEFADATISKRCDQKAEELNKLYFSPEFSYFDKNNIQKFINRYLNMYEKELAEKANSYENGHGEKFRLNTTSVSKLRESVQANYYNGSIGLYLKAIFEEYASKPTHIREQIFFHDIIEEINKAISRECKLKLSLVSRITNDGAKTYTKKFYFTPYKIVQDKAKLYNYLIGFSEEIIDKVYIDEDGIERKTFEKGEKLPSCIRISRIEKITMQSSMGVHISKDNKDKIDKMLIEREAMFMSSETVDVIVKFTDKGLENFRRNLHLRPQFYTINPKDKHIYTFKCTELQAMNYFFKFGWDVEIIEPIELRNSFIRRYENALKTYQGTSKEKIIEEFKNSNHEN